MEIPCIDSTNLENYFNLAEVKEALHVKNDIKFEVCSADVNNRYEIQEKGSIWAYKDLIAAGVRILIFNGDTDIAIPFNGNQKWIKALNLTIEKEWHTWKAYGDKYYVSGYYQKYTGLSFATIKATGHMATAWKSKEVFYLIDKFLKNQAME